MLCKAMQAGVIATNKKSSPTFLEEIKIWKKGFDIVIGIDEVGRGAFAGPVVVGAVVFDKKNCLKNENLSGINDSKLLKPLERKRLAKIVKEDSLCSFVSEIGVTTINNIGICKATQIAFRKVISKVIYSLEIENCKLEIPKQKYFVLVDGFHVKYIKGIGLKNQKAIVKGDRKSMSIAAASVIAKVHRDELMKNLSKNYPQYRFSKNKGYGTKDHQKAIKENGLCEMHRKSFNLSKFL